MLQFTERVFGLPQQHFAGKHHLLLRTLRHQLVPSTLESHSNSLLRLLCKELNATWCNGNRQRLETNQAAVEVELYSSVKTVLFSAAVTCLFGPAFVHRHGAPTLQAAFTILDDGFELAASPVPHWLQPKFTAARHRLLGMLHHSFEAGDFRGTVVESLIEGCGLPGHVVPNMLLAVLWASQVRNYFLCSLPLRNNMLPSTCVHCCV
jgi:hypothetical protein